VDEGSSLDRDEFEIAFDRVLALRLAEMWKAPEQSWGQWWDGDTEYCKKINEVVEELTALAGNDPYLLQSLQLYACMNAENSRYARLLGIALCERVVELLINQNGITREAAIDELLQRSREITGSYNYGTEMRFAAAQGSANGPMVAMSIFCTWSLEVTVECGSQRC
jgi:hypothetical protein